MAKKPIRQLENELSETLSAIKGILLQLMEFGLFIAGLWYVLTRWKW